MADRASAFADDEVAALLRARFVPVADNCTPLQSQQDAEGDFFRLLAEQGHYAGRVHPTATRQGMYAAGADGRVYGACNVNHPGPLREMLRAALARWDAEPHPGSPGGPGLGELAGHVARGRHHMRPPAGGLVLRVWVRDLPRDPATDTRPADWRRTAHNLDHAWFTAEEAASMVPPAERRSKGERWRWPQAVVQRLARFHLVDSVRGETPPWSAEEVRSAEAWVTVQGALDGVLHLRLGGTASMAGPRRWVDDFSREAHQCEHAIEVRLDGRLEWDDRARRFRRFDAAAVGMRRGGTKYNVRRDDPGPAPIGYWLELAPGALGEAGGADGGLAVSDRTPPWAIGWRDYFGQGVAVGG